MVRRFGLVVATALMVVLAASAGQAGASGVSAAKKGKPTGAVRVQKLSRADARRQARRASAAAAGGAVIDSADCTANTLARNDDGSTGQIGLPFPIKYFGRTYSNAYVNNNGNITFDNPMRTFTPYSITASVPPIIAPFFADVDTRSGGSSVVSWGNTSFGARPAFCVNWVDVGYFPMASDKTNSFQLLLVDRSDIGEGDFDIVMNFDRIAWETGSASGGSNGFGGTSAGAGFSNGDSNPDHYFEFPGSLVNGAFLDSNLTTGLIYNSRDSQTPGRYIFPVRNGLAPGAGAVHGTVTDIGGSTVDGSPIEICPDSGSCLTARTTSTGYYSQSGMAPGHYRVRALPPASSSLLPSEYGDVTLGAGDSAEVNLRLRAIVAPPADSGVSSDHGDSTSDGIPTAHWDDPLTINASGCANGTGSYRVIIGDLDTTGSLVESPVGSGHYTATVPAVFPNSGAGAVSTSITCPDPDRSTHVDYGIYVSPSGRVVDTHGTGVANATVTLLRSDNEAGPFAAVPANDPVMTPANRVNPDQSSSDGRFGWGVISGWYRVTATAPGCLSAADLGSDTATTGSLQIPPPATNLTLTLDCESAPNAPTIDSAPAGSTESTSAEIQFTKIASATAECRLDGGSWTACTSPAQFSGLGSGNHTFSVRQSLGASRTSDAADVGWTVVPGVALSTLSGTVVDAHGQPVPNATVTLMRADVAGGDYADVPPNDPGMGGSNTDNPVEVDGSFVWSLAPGHYQVRASATDCFAAGDNTMSSDYSDQVEVPSAASTGITLHLDCDSQLPAPLILTAPGNSAATSVSVSFETLPIMGAECSLDGSAWAACTSPASYDGLAVGPHTFAVRQTLGARASDPVATAWSVFGPTGGPLVTDTRPTVWHTSSYWYMSLGQTFTAIDSRGSSRLLTVQISTASTRPLDSQPRPTRPSYRAGVVAWSNAGLVRRQSLARPRWVRVGTKGGSWSPWVELVSGSPAALRHSGKAKHLRSHRAGR